MLDMLVKLYELPPINPLLETLRAEGIDVRRGLAPEKHLVAHWVREQFHSPWASETETAYAHQPISCWVATHEGNCVGFACYDTTAKAFFGPTGVDETYRGKGIGRALLLVCLYDMLAQGYAYAIIGDAGPMDFYVKAVGAVPIPGSNPGVYRGMLHGQEE